TIAGSGTLVFGASTTYSGPTTISSGTLRAGVINALSPNSAFTVNGMLDLAGYNQTIGSLSGATGINVLLGEATLTTGGDGSSTVFRGVISGSGGLHKVGSGTLTLSGVNTYTGSTTIDGGAVRLTENN